MGDSNDRSKFHHDNVQLTHRTVSEYCQRRQLTRQHTLSFSKVIGSRPLLVLVAHVTQCTCEAVHRETNISVQKIANLESNLQSFF